MELGNIVVYTALAWSVVLRRGGIYGNLTCTTIIVKGYDSAKRNLFLILQNKT